MDITELMDSWVSSKYTTELDLVPQTAFQSQNVKFYEKMVKPSQGLIGIDTYKNLISIKNQIETIPKNRMKEWNKWVRLLNPYEKIGSFSSLDQSKIVSRAFYKFYELMVYFGKEYSSPVSLHLCEAPGGFVSAIKYFYSTKNKTVNWYAHSLYTGADALDIDKSLDPSRWLLYGKGDGDLYKIETIIDLQKELPQKADIISGDGGFDVSYDPNNQEQLSFRLIFSQFITALHTQNIGGTFFLKIFDTITRPTCQLVYLAKRYYKNVYLIKPRTSRYSNSEKYLVAIGFKGIDKKELEEYAKMLDPSLWEGVRFCRSLGIHLESFDKLKTYNDFLSQNQAWYIHQSICCLKYFRKSNQYSQFNPNNLEALQNKRALEFCTAFGLKPPAYGNKKCSHMRVTKINIKNTNLKNTYRCNRCMTLLIQ